MEYDEPEMNRKEKKELALTEIVLIILAVLGLAVIVWVGWFRPAQRSGGSVDSYAECVAAGNPVQESYPEVCVAPGGQRFVNAK